MPVRFHCAGELRARTSNDRYTKSPRSEALKQIIIHPRKRQKVRFLVLGVLVVVSKYWILLKPHRIVNFPEFPNGNEQAGKYRQYDWTHPDLRVHGHLRLTGKSAPESVIDC
jgi:hypothetical protein